MSAAVFSASLVVLVHFMVLMSSIDASPVNDKRSIPMELFDSTGGFGKRAFPSLLDSTAGFGKRGGLWEDLDTSAAFGKRDSHLFLFDSTAGFGKK